MMQQYFLMRDERLEAAISEMQERISAAFPNTTFTTTHQDDPAGIYLIATVTTDNLDAVVDCFIDRLLTMQVDEKLPLYVIPVRKAVRVTAQPPATRFGIAV